MAAFCSSLALKWATVDELRSRRVELSCELDTLLHFGWDRFAHITKNLCAIVFADIWKTVGKSCTGHKYIWPKIQLIMNTGWIPPLQSGKHEIIWNLFSRVNIPKYLWKILCQSRMSNKCPHNSLAKAPKNSHFLQSCVLLLNGQNKAEKSWCM